MTGTVTRVLLSKGFGFIRGEDGVSRFFHAKSVVLPTLFDLMHEGQTVEFTEATDETGKSRGNGLRAEDVRVVQ